MTIDLAEIRPLLRAAPLGYPPALICAPFDGVVDAEQPAYDGTESIARHAYRAGIHAKYDW